ncbi:Transcription initiation factor TFIID subunit 9B, partial [Nowakowskiella sp. JEL0078]
MNFFPPNVPGMGIGGLGTASGMSGAGFSNGLHPMGFPMSQNLPLPILPGGQLPPQNLNLSQSHNPNMQMQNHQIQQRSGASNDLPRDARMVSLLLLALDIDEYEPRVVPLLLEFMHRYVSDVLQDAQLFAEHAGHPDIDLSDIKLAVEARVANSFTTPPSKEFMLELADKKNAAALPLVPEKFGIRMPPERHTLTG